MTKELQAVHDAAEILYSLNTDQYYEYFVAAGNVKKGERSAREFNVETNVSPLGAINLATDLLLNVAERYDFEMADLLHVVGRKAESRKRGMEHKEETKHAVGED